MGRCWGSVFSQDPVTVTCESLHATFHLLVLLFHSQHKWLHFYDNFHVPFQHDTHTWPCKQTPVSSWGSPRIGWRPCHMTPPTRVGQAWGARVGIWPCPQHPRQPLHVCRNNCRCNTVIIALVNSVMSLYTSITIFAIMGFKVTNGDRQCLDRCVLPVPAQQHLSQA